MFHFPSHRFRSPVSFAYVPLLAFLSTAQAEDLPEPIVGGSNAGTCDFPSVVYVRSPSGGVCTGTLIHPSIVVTAAHCLEKEPGMQGARELVFGETSKSSLKRSAYCFGNYDYLVNDKREDDWAYCELDTPMTSVPIVPPLFGCESDILKAGQEVVGVGFGISSWGGSDVGTKRVVTTSINSVSAAGVVSIGDTWKGFCGGDSGGPVFVKLADKNGQAQGWRVFGIVSGSDYGQPCASDTVFSQIAFAIPTIESETGIDVTPCHDGQTGAWAPAADCKGAPLSPGAGIGSWPSCGAGSVSGPITTCGANNPGGAGSGGGSSGSGGAGSGGADGGGTGGFGSTSGSGGFGSSPGTGGYGSAAGTGGAPVGTGGQLGGGVAPPPFATGGFAPGVDPGLYPPPPPPVDGTSGGGCSVGKEEPRSPSSWFFALSAGAWLLARRRFGRVLR